MSISAMKAMSLVAALHDFIQSIFGFLFEPVGTGSIAETADHLHALGKREIDFDEMEASNAATIRTRKGLSEPVSYCRLV